jgi:hypothetical protein
VHAVDADNGGMSAPVSRFLGAVLRGAIALILLVRRPRPIHADGAVFDGEMTPLQPATPSGVGWIDQPTARAVPIVARVSRSVGFPSWLPDVYGLAIRWEHEDAAVDLELSSTGIGVPGRFALVPRLTPSRATFSSILPYRSARGPVLLCARTVPPRSLPADVAALRDAVDAAPWRLRLYFAEPTGTWHPFAEVTLRSARPDDDAALRFDAVRNPLPGAGTYAWVRALRQPSYRLAQGTAEPDTSGALTPASAPR